MEDVRGVKVGVDAPPLGRRLAATGIGWAFALLAALPFAVLVAAIAWAAGASTHQIAGNGLIGVAVVVAGVHLPAGLLAAISMPAAWRRLTNLTSTPRQAARATVPTMITVAILEAVKAGLPTIGYLIGTVLQATVLLVPITLRGLPGAAPSR